MMLVGTYLGQSAIHGTGVFAAAAIAAGTRIWTHCPPFDGVLPQEFVAGLPLVAQQFVAYYAYRHSEHPDLLVLDGDEGKYMNHSDVPNSSFAEIDGFATVDIDAGTEITCDYREFYPREWWSRFDFLQA